MNEFDQICQQALQLSGDERDAYLKSLEDDVRKQVEEILAAHSAAERDAFLATRKPAENESHSDKAASPASDSPAADGNLLFGVLAWQSGVVTESQLLATMRAWTFAKSKSIGEILVEQSILTESQCAKLDQMVASYLGLHRNNASQALASLSSVPGVANSLRHQISDDEVQASLAHFDRTVISDSTSGADELASTLVRPVSTGESRYQIIKLHDRGGLGEVFVAKDQELNREVALKEIQSQFADHSDSRNRFMLEAEVTGGLEHPGIVPVYGLGQYEDGRPYYAMRFIKGDSLKDAITAFHSSKELSASERSLQLRKLLGRFIDVCQAISYAHSRGVLHRDLKPGNIMLGKYGETLVVDWGLAKVAGRDESTKTNEEQTLQPTSGSGVTPTLAGSAIGTPAYMPPEQAAGRLDELGPASDVYSLGATLYHLLTGVAPFHGRNQVAVLTAVQDGDFKPPRAIDDSIPKPLEAVCLQAMAVEPPSRYESPQSLAEDVERFLADEPVSAMVEPLRVKTRRWISKHRVLCSTAAASLLLSLIGVGVFFKLANDRAEQDARRAERDAQEQKQIAAKQTELTNSANDAREETEATLARSNYFLAVARWDANRAKEANDFLDKVPPKHRHFEWRLAKRQFRGSDWTCYGHTSYVRSVSFSPDGTRIASGSFRQFDQVMGCVDGRGTQDTQGTHKACH